MRPRHSPLAELRRRTQQRVLRPPPELEVDPTFPSEGNGGAYCPVRHEFEGEPWCGDVDCGECPLLARELDERAPDYAWVCSTCTDGFRALPYWKDGECDVCGFRSSLLMLVVPKLEVDDG